MMDIDSARKINSLANGNILYSIPAAEAQGILYNWPSYQQLSAIHQGVCSTYAIAKYVLMRGAGCSPAELALIIVKLPDGEYHMILGWYEDPKDPWILDNRDPSVWKGSETEYNEEYREVCFNEDKIWSMN